MATRSRIAIENQDGSVTSVYCHWDGHIETNGVELDYLILHQVVVMVQYMHQPLL